MGVEEAKWKKLLLKIFFEKCFKYYKDDQSFIFSNNDKNIVHMFDGSIKFEESLSMTNKLKKQTSGNSVWKTLFYTIIDYTHFENLYFLMDLSYRPPMKDIDTSRIYDKAPDVFKHVNDKHFPLCEDQREKKLAYLIRTRKKMMRDITKLDLSILKNK